MFFRTRAIALIARRLLLDLLIRPCFEAMNFSKSWIVAGGVLVGLLVNQTAFGDEPSGAVNLDPMHLEMERFVLVSRSIDSLFVPMQAKISSELSKPGANRPYFDCLSLKIKPVLHDVAYSAAESTFRDIGHLHALNIFLDSSAGRLILASGLREVEEDERSEATGQKRREVPKPQYTAAEVDQVEAWYKSPAYADYVRFTNPGLRNAASSPTFKAAVHAVGAACAEQVSKHK